MSEVLDPDRRRPECPMGDKPCHNPVCTERCHLLGEDVKTVHKQCTDRVDCDSLRLAADQPDAYDIPALLSGAADEIERLLLASEGDFAAITALRDDLEKAKHGISDSVRERDDAREGATTLNAEANKWMLKARESAAYAEALTKAAQTATVAIYDAVSILPLIGNQSAIAVLTNAKQELDAALPGPDHFAAPWLRGGDVGRNRPEISAIQETNNG